jgi:hypothetical protein
MRKQTKAEKAIDARIAAAFHRTCSGVQIPMMQIPGIFRSVRAGMTPDFTDEQLDTLVTVVVEVARVNGKGKP